MSKRIFAGLCATGAFVGVLYSAVGYEGNEASAKTSAREPTLFSSLTSASEMMALDVTEQGCFHRSRYRLQYTPSPSPRITVFRYGNGGGIASWLPATGTVTLTRAQVERLDNRLRFYRANREGGCTTRNTVTLASFRGGRLIRSEKFEDASCSVETFADADPRDIRDFPNRQKRFPNARPVLSLDQLMAISERSRKQGKPLPYEDVMRQETAAWNQIREHRENLAKKKSAAKTLRALLGFAKIDAEYTVSGEDRGHYSRYGDSFSVDLTARGNRIIDKVYWYNAAKNNKPTYDWRVALSALDKAEKRARKIPWLAAWKAKNSNHRVRLTLAGIKLVHEDMPELYVDPVWKHSRLKGKPIYELNLRWGKNTSATILLSEEDDRVLMTSISPPNANWAKIEEEPGIWFSGLKISYHPSEKVPGYATIESDGRGKQNTCPDSVTPVWFAAYMRKQSD